MIDDTSALIGSPTFRENVFPSSPKVLQQHAPFKSCEFPDIPRGLTLKNSALCTQSAFMWQGDVFWDVVLCRVIKIFQVTPKWRQEVPTKRL